MITRPRGTRDFFPDEMERRRIIEQRMREAVRRWGYREVCTPTFEHLELFTMKSGEGIIQEMYSFEDKGGRALTLRPEVTASVIRFYVNEGRTLPKPVRWFYIADCFRYERPQKGRYRQFWQFGVELIGADSAAADAEVILMGADVLRAAGISFDLHVGHLAPMQRILRDLDPADRRTVMAEIDRHDLAGAGEYLRSTGHSDLIEPLEALMDCRDPEELPDICGDIPDLPRILELIRILDDQEGDYTLDFGIARGLDYYTGMVFEAFAPNLGAENQVLGGGAYRLAHLFGGTDTPSCGFAIGFDRVMVSLGEWSPRRPPGVAVVCTPEARMAAWEVARRFREAGVRAEIDVMGRGLGQQLAHAARSADYAAVIGAREVAAGTVTLRDLRTGDQEEVPIGRAIAGVSGDGNR
ncbi:MAG: histidine--tRNA ligase [Methanoculleaceae archaeon]